MKTHRGSTNLLKLIPAFILCSGISPVLGQEPVSDETSTPPEQQAPEVARNQTPDDDVVILDPFEITEEQSRYGAVLSISGSRQAIALKELPRSISVITNELIEDTNSQTVLESIRYASSINISPDDGTAGGEAPEVGRDLTSRVRIRAFDISTVYRNFNPTQYTPWGPLIERIEVVKGPASALYGRAAPGGTVNFLTKRPHMQKRTSVSLAAGVQGVSLFRGTLDHENVLADGELGYRLVAAYQNSDGVKDFTPDNHKEFLGSVRWEPTNKDTVLFEFEYADNDGHGGTSVDWKEKIPGVQRYGTIKSHPEDRLFNPQLRTDFADTKSSKGLIEYRRGLFDGWNAQVNYEHSIREVRAQFTQFGNIRTDSENIYAGVIYNPEGARGNDENLYVGYQQRWDDRKTDALNATVLGDFELLGTRNNLVVGGTYFQASSDIYTQTAALQETRAVRIGCPPNCPPGYVDVVTTRSLQVPLKLEEIFTYDFIDLVENATDEGGRYDNRGQPAGPDGLPDYIWRLGQDSVSDFENKAFFAMNTTQFWRAQDGFNRVRLMYGGRYDSISQENTFVRITRNIETFEEETIPKFTEDSDSQWTYQVSAMFNIWKDVGLYYAYSDSFVQQFATVREKNVEPSRSTPAGPLLGSGQEAGVKFSVFEGKIAGTVAWFMAEENNRVKNVGSDKYGQYQQTTKVQNSTGIEMDIVVSPTPQWQTLIAVSGIDAELAYLDTNDPLGNYFEHPRGMPGWQARAFSSYRFTEGVFKGVMLGAGVDWVDGKRTRPPPELFGATLSVDFEHLNPYWVFDLVLGYEWRWGDFDYGLRLNIKNVTDERYFSGGDAWGNPRNSELTLKVGF